MDLLSIRRQAVRQTGRVDLVMDAAADNFGDNGMDYHIRAAHRFLERLCPFTKFQHTISEQVLAEGSYGVPSVGERFINHLYLVDGDKVKRLEQVEYHRLIDEYSKLVSAWPTGEPTCWARLRDASNLVGEQLLKNPGFASDLSNWSGVGHTWTSDGVVWPGVEVHRPLAQSVNIPAGTELEVSVEIHSIADGVAWDVRFTYDDFSSDTIGNTSDLSRNIVFIPERDVVSVDIDRSSGVADELIVRSVEVSTKLSHDIDIIVAPRADKQYGVQQHGAFYAVIPTSDEDSTYWMTNHPELVVDSTELSVEGRLHRNKSGEDAVLVRIVREVRQIYHDHISESIGDDTRMGG